MSSTNVKIKGTFAAISYFGSGKTAFGLIAVCSSDQDEHNGNIEYKDIWHNIRLYARDFANFCCSDPSAGDSIEFTGPMKKFRHKDKNGNIQVSTLMVMKDVLVIERKAKAA